MNRIICHTMNRIISMWWQCMRGKSEREWVLLEVKISRFKFPKKKLQIEFAQLTAMPNSIHWIWCPSDTTCNSIWFHSSPSLCLFHSLIQLLAVIKPIDLSMQRLLTHTHTHGTEQKQISIAQVSFSIYFGWRKFYCFGRQFRKFCEGRMTNSIKTNIVPESKNS